MALKRNPQNRIALLHLAELVESVEQAEQMVFFMQYYLDANPLDSEVLPVFIRVQG